MSGCQRERMHVGAMPVLWAYLSNTKENVYRKLDD